MDKQQVAETLEKAAAYVAETQPQLDKLAADQEQWATQAQRTAGVLANRGVLDASKVDMFVDKLAEDPKYALTFVEKLAGMIGSDSLGQPSNITKIANDQADPFTKALFPELLSNSTID